MIYLQKIKRIPSYPEYGCDQDGNVYSFKFNKLKRLSPFFDRYFRVHIMEKKNESVSKKVHRLVAETWLNDWDPNLQVDHIDRDPRNNKASNLRMVTQSQNNQNNAAKGVHYNKFANKWAAYCKTNGTLIQFYFDTEAEAIKKREELVKIYYTHNPLN